MCLAYFHQDQSLPGFCRYFLPLHGLILISAEGIVMHTNNVVRFNPISRNKGIIHIHGKVIANGQKGKIYFKLLPYNFHIVGQSGIAGKINGFSFRLHHISSRVAAVRTIGHRTGMHRIYHFNRPEMANPLYRQCSSGGYFFRPFCFEPTDNFWMANQNCIIFFASVSASATWSPCPCESRI